MKNIRVDELIDNQINQSKENYIVLAEQSLRFETGLRDCLNLGKAINLRNFIRQELDYKTGLYSVDCLTLLSPDFVVDRYLLSSVTVALCLNGHSSFTLVYANLRNFASFERFEFRNGNIGAKMSGECQDHLAWFIETESSVFFPLFNIITSKKHFYSMMGVEVIDKYLSIELFESQIFQILDSKKENICENKLEMQQIIENLDEIVFEFCSKAYFKMFSQNQRIRQIENILYIAIKEDRERLLKVFYNLSNGKTYGEHKPSASPAVDRDFYYIINTLLREN